MPAQTPAQPDPPMRKWLLAVVAAIPVLGILWACTASALDDGRSSTPPPNRDRAEAVLACETRIEEQLRSPSTAEFDTDATLRDGTWTVAGTVDSQNGFGATVRSDYECTAVIAGGNVTTRIVSLEQR